MLGPDHLVLRYQRSLLANVARQALTKHRRDTLVIALGGGLLLVHEIDVIHTELASQAAILASHAARLLMAGAAISTVTGILRGRGAMRSAASLLSRPWLKPLPWPAGAWARARLYGCILPALAQTAFTTALAALLYSWTSWPDCCAAALLCAATFTAAFSVTAIAMRHDPHCNAPASIAESIAMRRSSFATLIAPIDRARPAWCGTWAATHLRRLSGILLFITVIIVAAIGCTIAIAQARGFVAVSAGWAAAHLIFLTLLNARPLHSPVLRAQPIGFVPAAIAIIRIPFILSLLTFAALGAIAVTAIGAPPSLVAAASALLLLANIIAGITAIGLPTQRKLALFLYASAILLTLYEQLEYGTAIYLCLAAFTALLFLQGRRSFRAQ
jgi:hypothetical protein